MSITAASQVLFPVVMCRQFIIYPQYDVEQMGAQVFFVWQFEDLRCPGDEDPHLGIGS